MSTSSIPQKFLIFGAASRIGIPLVESLIKLGGPNISLRLTTHDDFKIANLKYKFPSAEVVVADFNHVDTPKKAVEGMEGIFIVTGSGTDEKKAMGNLIPVLKESKTVQHIVRIVGMFPEFNPRLVPASMPKNSLPIQHPIAKQMLDESGLPVTTLNCGATFMDNWLMMKRGIREEGKLIWPSRLVPYIDPRDVGEIAARLFLSEERGYVGNFYTLNNGHDLLRTSDVAAIMSRVYGREIVADASKEAFAKEYGPMMGGRVEVLWAFFEFERANEYAWGCVNDFAERILGRKPVTVEGWLMEHKKEMLEG